MKCSIVIFLNLIAITCSNIIFGQSQSGCTITFPNNFNDQVNISDIYNPADCSTGDLVLTNLNDKNGLSSITFDSNITLNSLTLNYKAGNNPLEVIIPSGVVVNISTNMILNLTSSVQDKFLTVNGDLIVGQTLDFGGIDLEIDGTGLIDAKDIIGADDTSCSNGVNGGTGSCPTISAESCEDGAGSFCTAEPTLPIELLKALHASIEDTKVILNWTTASEENNDYFTIEKSVDGIEYSAFEIVRGAGISFEAIDYEVVDNAPELGVSYYRLRQTDFDGKTEIFYPISVLYSSLDSFGKLSFKNPIRRGENLRVMVDALPEENLGIIIRDIQGSKMVVAAFDNSLFEYQIPNNFLPGVYTITLFSAKSQTMTKLLVQ